MDRTLTRTLTGNGSAREIAERAMVSRSEWYRRLETSGVRAPMKLRSRLRLERAAYRLSRSEASVSEIGAQAGFAHTSAFSRAFARAYGLAPSAFRSYAPSEYRLPPFGGIHFAPGEASALDPRQGNLTMKLIDLWIADYVRAAELLLRAPSTAPESCAAGLSSSRSPFPWEPLAPRPMEALFDAVAGFAEPWIGMLDGGSRTRNDGTLENRLVQLHENAERFAALVHRFESEGSWDITFVDHGCEPPEVFSYGAVVLMVMVYSDHARVELDTELRSRGITKEFTTAQTTAAGSTP